MNNSGLEESVKILEKSKNVLFLTGAGMSADSGIPTFCDSEGFWNNFPIYKKLGLNPLQLANGKFFKNHPEISWGFYEWRRRNAQKNKPHEGYQIINDIIKSMDGFVITTNTDGYHLRSGIPADKILEVHGSMWRLQFLDGSENYVEENLQVPLCELDEKTMSVSQKSMPRYDGKILRPNVLMFEDKSYIENDAQKIKLLELEKLKADVVFLIGVGEDISPNLLLAKHYQRKRSKIICLNPNEISPRLNPDIYLQTTAEKGLSCLGKILNGTNC
ncbi:iron dicitrate transport regulator FecR [Candidatus Pacearchaeota archaeon]|nr:iron dicitrate transport regulator FecR [Candidatus Pacearchaeota archaeon]